MDYAIEILNRRIFELKAQDEKYRMLEPEYMTELPHLYIKIDELKKAIIVLSKT